MEEILSCGSPCIDVRIEDFTECANSSRSLGSGEIDIPHHGPPRMKNPCWYDTLPENEMGEKIDRSDKYIYRQRDQKGDLLCIFESYVRIRDWHSSVHITFTLITRLKITNSTEGKSSLKQFEHPKYTDTNKPRHVLKSCTNLGVRSRQVMRQERD